MRISFSEHVNQADGGFGRTEIIFFVIVRWLDVQSFSGQTVLFSINVFIPFGFITSDSYFEFKSEPFVYRKGIAI